MSSTDTKGMIADVREASRLLQGGRRSEALVIYHDLCQRAGNDAAVHLQLGYLCEEFGDIDEAVGHYETVVEQVPDNASHLATLGVACLNAQEYEKARDALDKALELDPDRPEVQHGLGAYYMRSSDFDAALGHLERACELKPSDASIRVNLASTLAKRDRFDEALKHIRKAVRLDKKNPNAQLIHAAILAQVGDMDDSQREIERLLRGHPHSGGAYDLLARLRKFSDEDSKLIRNAEKALQRGMAPDDRFSLLFALGKMYDDCGRYDEAFARFEQANLLKKKYYDVAADEKLYKAVAKAFTSDAIEALGRHGNPSRQPVFVVGMPRSGTTLIERIIASHPQGAGAGELPAIPRLAHDIFPPSEQRRAAKRAAAELGRDGIAEHTGNYLNILQQAGSDARRIVDKMPANSYFLGLIKVLFPNATIIHAIRNPLDTCLSCFFQNFTELHWASDFEVIAQKYGQYRKMMQTWYDVLPEGSIVEMRYEELVGDPETHARRLVDACGLEWDPGVLDFYRKKGVVRTASIAQTRQPIYKTSRQRWTNYAKYIEPLVAQLAPYLDDERELLAEHGVEMPPKPGLLKRLIG